MFVPHLSTATLLTHTLRPALALSALLLVLAPCPCQSETGLAIPPMATEKELEKIDAEIPDMSWQTPTAPAPDGPESSSPVPEPSTLLLVSTGILGIALTTRRRAKRSREA